MMSDTCTTHRSRVPWRSSGRIKWGAMTVEDERGRGLDFYLCFVCGSRPWGAAAFLLFVLLLKCFKRSPVPTSFPIYELLQYDNCANHRGSFRYRARLDFTLTRNVITSEHNSKRRRKTRPLESQRTSVKKELLMFGHAFMKLTICTACFKSRDTQAFSLMREIRNESYTGST